MFNNYFQQTKRFIFPSSCAICGNCNDRDIDLCRYCESHLLTIENPCKQCGLSLEESAPYTTCGRCLSQEPYYNSIKSLFAYDEPIKHLITALKFNSQLVNARLFGELILQKIKNEWYQSAALPELIIPMPLHTSRLRRRGFNQALEISKPIAKALDLQIDTHRCVRIKATKAQSELPANKRHANVKNAFASVTPINAKHIAIIDDVVTTGHTVNELSRMLKLAGVEIVDVWCCALTIY